MQRISATQLAAKLESESRPGADGADAAMTSKPLLLDVREPWEFSICHIDGSVNIPMSQLPANLDAVTQADEVVVICHHGVRSMQVIGYLEQRHDGNLVNLDGGVDAWAREVDRDMAVY